MCFSVSGKGARLQMIAEAQAAEEARKREEARQARLTAGAKQIDGLFNGAPVMGTRTVSKEFGADALPTGWAKKTREERTPSTGTETFWEGTSDNGGWVTRNTPESVSSWTDIYDTDGKVVGSAQNGVFGDQKWKADVTEEYETDQRTGGFDNAFYDKYKSAYLDYYNPDVEKQYTDAKEQLNYAHARAGTLNSSMAGENLADLVYQNDMRKSEVASKADAAAGQLRQNVAQQKSAAINQLYSTENPDIAANTALNSVRTIQNAQPEFSPLGDLFKSAIVGAGSYMQAYNDPWNRMGGPPSVNAGRNVT